jgi:phage host-nuclease inhibitor protein Gam
MKYAEYESKIGALEQELTKTKTVIEKNKAVGNDSYQKRIKELEKEVQLLQIEKNKMSSDK